MAIDKISLTFSSIGEIWYVRLGALLQHIEENIMYHSKVATQSDSTPILKFDYDVDSNLMYIEKELQTSIDPTICVLNREISVGGKIYNVTKGAGDPFDSPLFPDLPTTYGQIMNIYVSMSWILLKMDEIKDAKTNKVTLIDLLNNILSNINSSLGGTTSLEATIDETTNTVIIRDANPLPDVSSVIAKLNSNNPSLKISDKFALFDLYGYNAISGSASFIKDFSFKTEISPALSTMLTVGATANSTVVGENSTAFSKFNAGLTDRFKTEMVEGNSSTSPVSAVAAVINFSLDPNSPLGQAANIQERVSQADSQAVVNAELKATRDKYTTTLTKYYGYIRHLSEEPGIFTKEEAETYKDVLTNILTYQQQYRHAIRNSIYLNNPSSTLFAPSTGFIPFNMSLTMDGLSGMKIYSKFNIDTKFLPANYPDNVEFLIKNIQHKIENNKWFTTIESIVISKGGTDPLVYNKNKATLQQNKTTPAPSTSSAGNTKASKGNPSLKQVLINAGYKEGSKEYTFAYSIGKKEGWDNTANGGKGSRSYRNNNPGNLDYSNNLRKIDPGVTLENNPFYNPNNQSSFNRFAHFTTAELGAKALVEDKIKRWGNGNMPVTAGNTTLIEQKKGGPQYKKGVAPTIAQFVYTYAPPNENNTELYISNLLTDLKKVKPDTTRTTLVKQFFA